MRVESTAVRKNIFYYYGWILVAPGFR